MKNVRYEKCKNVMKDMKVFDLKKLSIQTLLEEF